MKLNFGHIIPPESGISEEMLYRYLRDEANHADTRLIDRTIEQDPIFADAVEGLMQVPTAELAVIFEHLDKKVLGEQTQIHQSQNHPISEFQNHQFQNLKISKSPSRWIWWAAASVAALFGAALWVFTKPVPTMQNTDNQVVVEELPSLKPAEIQPLDSINSQLPPLSNSSIAAAPAAKKSDIVTIGATESPFSDIEKTTPTVTQTDIAAVPAPAAELSEDTPQSSVQPSVKPVQSQESNVNQPNLKDRNASIAEGKISARAGADAQNQGQRVYSDKKMEESTQAKESVAYENDSERRTNNAPKSKPVVAKKQEAAKTDPTSSYSGAAQQNSYTPPVTTLAKSAQLFSEGERLHYQKKYAEAAAAFENVLKVEKKGDLHQKTQWLLANSYIQLNRKAFAKSLLNQIIAEGSMYAESAKSLLLKLGN